MNSLIPSLTILVVVTMITIYFIFISLFVITFYLIFLTQKPESKQNEFIVENKNYYEFGASYIFCSLCAVRSYFL